MKKILYIVFIFNFLFSLLTSILPLLVYAISNSAATSGYVLGTFMAALLIVRFFLLKVHFSEESLLKVGLILYCMGFGLLVLDANSLFLYYVGASFLGLGVGIVSPVLLTLIVNIGDNKKLSIGLHNSFMGMASATAPFLGLYLFYGIENKMYLYLFLFSVAITTVLTSFFIKKQAVPIELGSRLKHINKNVFSLDYVINYIAFLLISLCYGAVIAYLPLLLEGLNLRIDIFYLFFWLAFLLSQVYTLTITSYISEKIVVPITILLITISTYLIGDTNNYVLLIINAVVFGSSYGGLMNLFYNRIAKVKDNMAKTDAFSIFGLMSYLGVSLGSLILSPIASESLSKVFYYASAFPIFALIMNIVFSLFANKRGTINYELEK
ncbi:MFS transporter [Lysinibacillus sp. NPDC059133]|uniref:MFS transporter n=1 Tax=Lysinibacillus sp. NPDC059133 TaxID=3346737 RepID=UPI00368D86BD